MVNLGKPHAILFYFCFLALLLCHWCAQVEYNIITHEPPSKCTIHCAKSSNSNFCCCGEFQNLKLCTSSNATCVISCRKDRGTCCLIKH
ncbi:hypothetical protein Hanom_Chr02g00096141 [Helianthus anomalus]